MSYVTGEGANSDPHCYSNIYNFDGKAGQPQGYVAGGANQVNGAWLSNFGAKCYTTSNAEWTTNENDIIWNSGLVFDVALLDSENSAATNGLVSINTGGPAVSPFVADADFSGGTTVTNWTGAIDTSAVTNPAPQAVYQTERYGTMTYTMPGLTSGTNYTVRLHFCENYWSAAGQRKFNVSINGISVLSNFDIFATVGAQHRANIQQFTAAANSNGQIIVSFTNVTDHAVVNGIEVATSDTAQYNFESGTQNWTVGGAPLTGVTSSTAQAFKGTHSLAVAINGAAGLNRTQVFSPAAGAGSVVTYHIWVPSGSQVTAVQPFVEDHNWAWTGNWQAIGSLTTNAWNTLTLTVPSSAAMPLQALGVEFTIGATWNGTCYVDSVSW
jgi:hypothetical protein